MQEIDFEKYFSEEFKMLLDAIQGGTVINYVSVVDAILHTDTSFGYKFLKKYFGEKKFKEFADAYARLNRGRVSTVSGEKAVFSDDMKTILEATIHFFGGEKINSIGVLDMGAQIYPNTKISSEIRSSIDPEYFVAALAEISSTGTYQPDKATPVEPVGEVEDLTDDDDEPKNVRKVAFAPFRPLYVDRTYGVRRRDIEDNVVNMLCKSMRHHVLLVGDHGVGKTEIVHNVAKMIKNDEVPDQLSKCNVLELNMSFFANSKTTTNQLAGIVDDIFSKMRDNAKKVLVIENVDMIADELFNSLSYIFSDCKMKVIATTTPGGLKHLSSETFFLQNFNKINVEVMEESKLEEAIAYKGSKLAAEHKIHFKEDIIPAVSQLAKRYIKDEVLPGSAINAYDLACVIANTSDTNNEDISEIKKVLIELVDRKRNAAKNGDGDTYSDIVRMENQLIKELTAMKKQIEADRVAPEVKLRDIAKAISIISGIDINKLDIVERDKIISMEDRMNKIVIGQKEAVNELCRVIRRSKIGLSNPNKPKGVYMFMGGSGVGKTLLVKKIAEEVYGDEKNMLRIDMSEYSEKHSVSRLIGSPPGYVGYDNGGQLTEAIKRNPNSVILLDEIEKADKEIYNIFLQVFDEGRLTDGRGVSVDMTNTIIVMTSNVGSQQASEDAVRIGFDGNDDESRAKEERSIIDKAIKRQFKPEFLNRIDHIVYFNSLSDDSLIQIAAIELKHFNERLNKTRHNLVYNDDVVKYIAKRKEDERRFGARPILRRIQSEIVDKLVDLIIQDENIYQYRCELDKDGGLKIFAEGAAIGDSAAVPVSDNLL